MIITLRSVPKVNVTVLHYLMYVKNLLELFTTLEKNDIDFNPSLLK